MGRFFLKFFLTILILAVFSIIFLSYFGLETDKFDDLIKGKANEVNRYVRLEFKNTKIHLRIFDQKVYPTYCPEVSSL